MQGPGPGYFLLALGILSIFVGQILFSKNTLRSSLLFSVSGVFLAYVGWTLRIGVSPWFGKVRKNITAIEKVFSTFVEKSPSLTLADRRVHRRGLSLTVVSVIFLALAVYLLKDGRLELALRYKWESLGAPVVLIALSIILLGISIYILPKASYLPAVPTVESKAKKVKWFSLGAILSITAVAAWFRLSHIQELPSGCWFDEAENGLAALDILNGKSHPIFIDRWPIQNSAFFIWQIAGFFKVLGVSVLSIRLVSVVSGILCIPIFYLMARQMMGRMPALAGSFMLAVLRWHVTQSRIGFWCIQQVLFEMLALLFLWRAVKTGRLWNYIGAGLFLGLGIHTYAASRLVVVVFVAWAVYLLGRQVIDYFRKTKGARDLPNILNLQALKGSFLIVATSGAVVLPLVLSAGSVLWRRGGETTIYKWLPPGVSGLEIFLEPKFWISVMKHLLMFNYIGDPNGRHNIPGWPMLEPILGTLFLLGLILAFLRLWDSRGVLALILLVVMLQAGIWTVPFEAPQSLRSVGAIPAVVLLATLALEYLWGLIRGSGLTNGKLLFGVGLVLAMVWAATNSFREYFIDGPKDQYVWEGHSTRAAHVGKTLREIKDMNQLLVWGLPQYKNHPTVRFVSGGRTIHRPIVIREVFPLLKTPEKPLLLFFNISSDLHWITTFYPWVKVERLLSKANQSVALYTVSIQPKDVESSFGLTPEGKGILWLPGGRQNYYHSQAVVFSLSGPGTLLLDDKVFMEGPGAKLANISPGKHQMQLDGGRPENLSVNRGVLLHERQWVSSDSPRGGQ